jgi:hypothetical protein
MRLRGPSLTQAKGGFTTMERPDAATNTPLRIVSVARQTTDVVMTWTTAGGRINALERSAGSNGSFSNNFAAIFTVTNTVGTITNYLDLSAATNVPSLYYRIRLVP